MNHALKFAISLPTSQKNITLQRSCSWMQALWLPESSSVLTCLVPTLELGVLLRRGALILNMNTDWNSSINTLPVMDMQMEQEQL